MRESQGRPAWPGEGGDSAGSGLGSAAVLADRPTGPPPVFETPPLAGKLPGGVFGLLEQAGAMAQLLGEVVWSAIRRPVGYWRAVRDEMYTLLKLCWFPMILAVFTFGVMVAILGINFTTLIGANNRYGQYFFIASVREFSPWINSMVVAGIIGAALAADLGARRVREELDALKVLGMDPVRELVLPRVVSAVFMTALLNMVAIMIAVLSGLFGIIVFGGVSGGEYFSTLYANLTPVEVWGSFIKSAVFGLVIGVVCSYKGFTAQGGAIGVGRAVNQAVVISFVVIWLVDFAFSSIMLGLNPEMQTVR
ncbi:ABC transporter permease [Amycolatopsis acidicola]|uniref:ABC transporter permease n=1 Tax=Amycolatopsis acidicola TaxID=2596893 RepID=A0A5N0UR68_9PSEU|nr:ABC transporter permease [Amycolatopsis acidicola]KAA9153974.1 ABC transporter permease [Amycolatopsis acidicola]